MGMGRCTSLSLVTRGARKPCMRARRLMILATGAVALALPSPAIAVIKGAAAGDHAYPAQVFIGRDTDGNGETDANGRCVGTLVGSRQILTAARCATYGSVGVPRLPPENFEVLVGDARLSEAKRHDVAPGGNDINDAYSRTAETNDVAMLTLAEPVSAGITPVRVVDAGADVQLWQRGIRARVLGWGEVNGAGLLADVLRFGDLTIRADDQCPTTHFTKASMVCAASTATDDTGNPCTQDSGSPLLVPDGDSFALGGVFSGAACASATHPGLFARVGDDPLNAWVHERTPEADFAFVPDRQPRAGVPFDLVSTSRDPESENYFTRFRWDLDDDLQFDDATGRRITLTIPEPGPAIVGLEASRPATGSVPEGDTTSAHFRFDVLSAAGQETGPESTTTQTAPAKAAPLATILAAKRPEVKRGRFAIRIRFAKTAPRGTAVIEVYRGGHRIGIGRTRVKRGATKSVRVKLTRSGRRALSRAANHRLKVRVRVRVGRAVLRTKRLTIRG
jgi:hypothetical protein